MNRRDYLLRHGGRGSRPTNGIGVLLREAIALVRAPHKRDDHAFRSAGA
jgi:hypothetical protein